MPCGKGCENCDRICDLCNKKLEMYSIYFFDCNICYNRICFTCMGITKTPKDLYLEYMDKCIREGRKVFNDTLSEEYGIKGYNPDDDGVLELFEDEYLDTFIIDNYKCVSCVKPYDEKKLYLVRGNDLARYKKLEEENKRLIEMLEPSK